MLIPTSSHDLYTQRVSRLMLQMANLQQRLENVLKPPLRPMPTKPRLNFSRSAPRLASTLEVEKRAREVNVEVVLRINDEDIRISGDFIENMSCK